jgi:hypothetical protein
MTEQMRSRNKYKMQDYKANLKINSYVVKNNIFYKNEISHSPDSNTVIFTISPSILHL